MNRKEYTKDRFEEEFAKEVELSDESKRSIKKGLLIFFVVVLASSFLYWLFGGTTEVELEAKTLDICQSKARQLLKYPNTARFKFARVEVVHQSPWRVRYSGDLESQNDFGLKKSVPLLCNTEELGTGLRVTFLSIDGQVYVIK